MFKMIGSMVNIVGFLGIIAVLGYDMNYNTQYINYPMVLLISGFLIYIVGMIIGEENF